MQGGAGRPEDPGGAKVKRTQGDANRLEDQPEAAAGGLKDPSGDRG